MNAVFRGGSTFVYVPYRDVLRNSVGSWQFLIYSMLGSTTISKAFVNTKPGRCYICNTFFKEPSHLLGLPSSSWLVVQVHLHSQDWNQPHSIQWEWTPLSQLVPASLVAVDYTGMATDKAILRLLFFDVIDLHWHALLAAGLVVIREYMTTKIGAGLSLGRRALLTSWFPGRSGSQSSFTAAVCHLRRIMKCALNYLASRRQWISGYKSTCILTLQVEKLIKWDGQASVSNLLPMHATMRLVAPAHQGLAKDI